MRVMERWVGATGRALRLSLKRDARSDVTVPEREAPTPRRRRPGFECKRPARRCGKLLSAHLYVDVGEAQPLACERELALEEGLLGAEDERRHGSCPIRGQLTQPLELFGSG